MNISAKAGHGQLTLCSQGKNRTNTHILSLFLCFSLFLPFPSSHTNINIHISTLQKKKSLSRYIQVCKHCCQDPQTSLLCCSQVCLGPEKDCYSKTAAALVTVDSQAVQRAKNRAKRKKGQTKTNAEPLDGQGTTILQHLKALREPRDHLNRRKCAGCSSVQRQPEQV